MNNAQRIRLVQTGIFSLVLHFLLLAVVERMDWGRERPATPYRGPLRVKLPPPASPKEPEAAEPPEERKHTAPAEEPIPQEAASLGESTAPAGFASGTPSPAGSPDPYADLFDFFEDPRPVTGQADIEAPVKPPIQTTPSQFSRQGGIRYDEAETAAPPQREEAAKPFAGIQPDFSDLDTALAARTETERSDRGESASELPGEAFMDIPLGKDEVRLSLSPSLGERVGGFPSIVLDDELRRKIREEGHPVFRAEFGFIVTPEGLIKGLHLLDSSGNTSLDQALRQALGVEWNFRPAAGAEELEGRVKITVQVK